MLRLTSRLQRTGLIGVSAFGAAYGLMLTAVYFSAAGTTAAQHVAFGKQMEVFGRSFTYLLPVPVRVDTLGGYVQWRLYGPLPLLLAFWALMSATGAIRGDEEHGLVELWLSAGVGRARYVIDRFLGFLVALVVVVLATSVAVELAAKGGGSTLSAGSLIEMAAALVAVTVACYGLALVVAQLTGTRNTAAGVTGALLAVLFFVDSFGRTIHGLGLLSSAISPFYYYDRSNPLVPGGSFDAPGTLGLMLLGLILVVVAAWLMLVRDVGSPLVRPRFSRRPISHHPSHNPLLRLPVTAGLYEQRMGLLAWVLGGVIGAAVLASAGREMVNLASTGSLFRSYLATVGRGDPYVTLTGYLWMGIFQVLLAVYAIVQVSRWSSDDSQGRLEMVLSAPMSRSHVVLDRALTLTESTATIVAVSSIVLYISARANNINLPAGNLAIGSVVLIPFTLSFAAVGMLLTSRVPRATVAILTTLAFISYLLTELGPFLKWPNWTLKLSVFSLAGTPLSNGLYSTGLWILLAVTLTGFGLGAVAMQRRDVGS